MQFVAEQSRKTWAVIGGGPCGIATVGKLLDLHQSVVWFDPDFQSGRMGRYYRKVPANTLNGDLLVGARLCQSFRFDDYQEIRRKRGEKVMADLPPNICYELGYLVDALEDMTTELLHNVKHAVAGKVTLLERLSSDQWKVTSQLSTGDERVDVVDVVILIPGCIPKPLPITPAIVADQAPAHITLTTGSSFFLHSLDLMVDPLKCAQTAKQYPLTDKWLVIGDSHSGMLVVKNLIEAGIPNVLNFYRSPLRFMHITASGCKK